MTSPVDVIDNNDQQRFEAIVDDQLATLNYRRTDSALVLAHTEVPEALGGRGLGGQLVAAAVEAAVASGLAVKPLCPFARSWLDRHPDVAARVPVVEDLE